MYGLKQLEVQQFVSVLNKPSLWQISTNLGLNIPR